MGVIYEAGDDVAELLIPFIFQRGGLKDATEIRERYIEASLGRLSAARFWETVGIECAIEDQYLSLHRLRPDVGECLRRAQQAGREVCCISNDIAEWSMKLRVRHQLAGRISKWFVSGDIGSRKPDEAIYRSALNGLGVPASKVLFVDDRPKNLDTAWYVYPLAFCRRRSECLASQNLDALAALILATR